MSSNEEFFKQWVEFQHEITIRRVYVDIAQELRAGAVLGYITREVTNKRGVLHEGRYWMVRRDQKWWDVIGVKRPEVDRAIETLQLLGVVETKTLFINEKPRPCVTINEERLSYEIGRALDNG